MRLFILGLISLLLSLYGCAVGPPVIKSEDGAPPGRVDLSHIPEAVPRAEPISRYGNPESYVVYGRSYHPLPHSSGYVERGIASWYGTKFHGRRTSSGETYNMYSMTAAHKTLPLPTYARITNLQNGRSIVVKINDRGPFHDNRLIDLSYAAAARLDILGRGTGLVEVRAVDPAQPAPATNMQAATAPAKNPELFLQVGAFGSRVNARQLKQRIQPSIQEKIRIQEAGTPASPLFRVQIGPLGSIELADTLSNRLTQQGLQDMHISVD